MTELALTIVPLIALMLAIIDFSLAILAKNTMQFAVRQGVRYAVTSQVRAGMGHDASIKAVVNENSLGFLKLMSGNSDPLSKVSITYYDPATLLKVTGVGSNAGGNIVQVSVNGLSWAWMAPLLRTSNPLTIRVGSMDVMESSPNGIPPNR